MNITDRIENYSISQKLIVFLSGALGGMMFAIGVAIFLLGGIFGGDFSDAFEEAIPYLGAAVLIALILLIYLYQPIIGEIGLLFVYIGFLFVSGNIFLRELEFYRTDPLIQEFIEVDGPIFYIEFFLPILIPPLLAVIGILTNLVNFYTYYSANGKLSVDK